MAHTGKNGQTYLESIGIEEREKLLVKNDYFSEEKVSGGEYSNTNKDAMSGDHPLGKGTGHGGHLHDVPDPTKSKTGYSYRNFDTDKDHVGGLYDRMGIDKTGMNAGRNFLLNINVFDPEHEYGINYVDTTANRQDGQIVVDEYNKRGSLTNL